MPFEGRIELFAILNSWKSKTRETKQDYERFPTSFASFINEMKFSSSNSISFDIRSLATPSKISSDLRRPAPTAASQQHNRTYKGSPAYPETKFQELNSKLADIKITNTINKITIKAET